MHPSAPFHLDDPTVAWVAVVCALAVLAWLLMQGARVRRARARVPTVVHVGGTRGKTTVVWTLATALERQGLRVLAKSTGSAPLLRLPGGAVRRWRRLGVPSVREQEAVLGTAARLRVDVLVLECMAIRPELVWATQHWVVRPDVTVVTNADPDHAEDLGGAPDGMVRSLMPLATGPGGVVVPHDAPPALVRAAAAAGVATWPADAAATVEGTVAALARATLAALGRPSDGEVPVVGDGSEFGVRRVRVDGRTLRLADAFAANDPRAWARRWSEDATAGDVVVLAARRDRPERTLAFLAASRGLVPAPAHVLVVGDVRLRRFAGDRAAPVPVEWSRDRSPRDVWRRVAEIAGDEVLVWGVGNRLGWGERLAACAEE